MNLLARTRTRIGSDLRLTGRISGVYGDEAVVKLDRPYHGANDVIINGDTAGRMSLMYGRPQARLHKETAVIITRVKLGSEALLALEIRPA